MTVSWTESALDDLRAVEAYLSRHSPGYARSMIERLFGRGDGLASHPQIGPSLRDYEAQGLREVYEDPYRLIYRVVVDRVEIIAVVHASRRLPPTLGGGA